MNMNKKSIAILCGGISSERDISLKTGQAVFDAINPFYNAEQIQLDDNFNILFIIIIALKLIIYFIMIKNLILNHI